MSTHSSDVTVENCKVMMPNSQMGQNQIVNYSCPDPSCYVQVNQGIAHENNPNGAKISLR
jgi:hypothetical protein